MRSTMALPLESSKPSKWFSSNPDKAFGEKLFLSYFPFFMGYQALLQGMGWVDVNDFWGVVTTLITWVPYLILLPLILRRNSGIKWYESYWFKVNVYMVVYVFFATYFHSEWFFESLGMRYNFPQQHLMLDSMLCGPDQTTALNEHQRVPLSRYFDTMGFFTVYHSIAIVCIRRIKNVTLGLTPSMQRTGFVIIVAVAAVFFAWAETYFYIQNAVSSTVWYIDKAAMLSVGTGLYALYFLVSFPNLYRLDETVEKKWSIWNCIVQASFVSMATLLLIDLWVMLHGPIV